MNANITSPESIRSRLWLKDACSPMEFKTFGSPKFGATRVQSKVRLFLGGAGPSIGGSDLM
jgi:hypothetical protein